jgi:hypothetical protein
MARGVVTLHGSHCRSHTAVALTLYPGVRADPFDKTKMTEVREWVNSNGISAKIRADPGVKDIEVSFCPGEGWLATRFIYNDLEDMKAYLGSGLYEETKKVMMSAPHLSWFKMASTLSEDTAPSPSLDCLTAQAAPPTHPRAPPEQLGGLP